MVHHYWQLMVVNWDSCGYGKSTRERAAKTSLIRWGIYLEVENSSTQTVCRWCFSKLMFPSKKNLTMVSQPNQLVKTFKLAYPGHGCTSVGSLLPQGMLRNIIKLHTHSLHPGNWQQRTLNKTDKSSESHLIYGGFSK